MPSLNGFGLADIKNGIIWQFGCLVCVATEAAESKPAVQHHVFFRIQRIRINQNWEMSRAIEAFRVNFDRFCGPFDGELR